MSRRAPAAFALILFAAAAWGSPAWADGGAGPADGSALAQLKGVGASAKASSRPLTFKAKPEGHGPNLTLGDLIAEPLPRDVAGLVVASAQSPGVAVTVDPALVALKLRRAPGGPWLLKSGYSGLRVEVPARSVSGESLARAARSYIEKALSGTAGVAIRPQGRVFGLTLYDAPTRFRVRPPDDHPLRGYVEMRVEVLQGSEGGEEKVVATVPASFLIQRAEALVFTTQPVEMGDPLGPQNLAVQVVDDTFLPDGFSSLDQVGGRVARTYIPQGRLLEPRMVDLPLAIHRGDEVRLLVRSGAIEVQTTAQALRDAHLGETLPLRVDSTQQRVQARCVDADTAVQQAW